MGNYQDETVKNIEELQDYSYGDKLTMALTGENADTGERNAIGQTADESRETNDKIDADVTPRLRSIVTNTRQTADNTAETNHKLDTDVTPKLAAIQAAAEKGNGQLDAIDADVKDGTASTGAKLDALGTGIEAGFDAVNATATANGEKADVANDRLRSIDAHVTANGAKADTGNTSLASIEELVGNINANIAGYAAGDGLKLENKVFSVTPAAADKIGGVKIGTGLSIADDGTVSASGREYQAGDGISISDDGTVAAAYPFYNSSYNEYSQTNPRSLTIGDLSSATGQGSVAMGVRAFASGDFSHAEGYGESMVDGLEASGEGAHAEGHNTQASGFCSHSEGHSTHAKGDYSHAEGYETTATGNNSHASGKMNIEDSAGKYAEIVGNGTIESDFSLNYSNARTLDWEGTGWFQNDVRCGGADQDSSDAVSLQAIGGFVKTIPAMEFGTSNSVTVPGNSHALVDVTFHGAKTEVPVVFPAIQCPTAGVNLVATVQSVTNSQASICVTNLGTADVDNITVDFLAISGR